MSVYIVTDVLDEARVLLNDVGIQIYTNAVLKPCFSKAFDELIRKIQNNGIALVFEQSAVISVAANATQVDISTLTNLITPIELHEKAVGAADSFYQPMNKVMWLPDIPQSTYITYWQWRKQLIFITSPLTARSVRVRYSTDFPTLALGDTVPVNNAKSFLAARTASIAAFAIGSNPSKAEVFEADAEIRKDEVIRHGVNDRQNLPARRRSFSIYRSSRYR